jgi:hypothetical protein
MACSVAFSEKTLKLNRRWKRVGELVNVVLEMIPLE